jgi:ubiquinone/menaquinone biosynthesis C-methylase UbiE
MASISAAYNARAAAYDDEPSFHRHLASEYVKYADPRPGERLLDLPCGTGLETFEFARILVSEGQKPTIIGVDISSGMLDVARSKVQQGQEISFVEHDITSLSRIRELEGRERTFDIIPSALH